VEDAKALITEMPTRPEIRSLKPFDLVSGVRRLKTVV
jgi:hypothetical protein